MGGRDAIRGFEYQFLCTLEHVLSEIVSGDTDVTAVQVEGVVTANLRADQEIVDFALSSGERTLVVAQVRSGSTGSSLTASEMLEMLARLLSHDAERYLVVTNRSAASNLDDLLALIRSGKPEIRDDVLALVGRAKVAEVLAAEGPGFWERLRRAEVVFDLRDIEQVRADVRDRVRVVRHRVAPSTVGWDATGLLTGYLVWEVMATAAGPHGPALAMTDLLAALRMDADTLKGLMRERDWAVHVTPAPRATDIARPELVARIAEHLPIPVPRDAAPVCLFAGLSGIGKSSLAAAWADDNAYAYAVIMWIDATSPSQVTVSFTAVAEWLQTHGLLDEGDAGLPVRERVFAALARSARPWLMVFDNCSDQAVVRDWIPPRGHGHTIVTSTDQSSLSGPSTAKIDIRGMTDAEATRLLARRVLGDRQPSEDEHHSLLQLADRLHHWPLALELAAAYLVSTLLVHTPDLGRGIADFERLLERAMDDRPSVPLSYPDTVVGAITLTWQRVADRTGRAETLATNALRSAAFVASRQIPLHLLLGSADDDVFLLFPHYAQDDPPVGEVLRALTRDSLVAVDEPLPVSAQAAQVVPGAAGSLSVSVAMNDIVQFIVRSLVDREGHTADVLFRVTLCTQAWLSFFSSNDEMTQAVSLLGHGIEVAEHAIDRDAQGSVAALVCGNTAGILGYLDEWARAAWYLAAELDCLESSTEPDTPLLRIQALVAFANALYEVADHPRDTVDEIVPCLERFVTEVPGVIALDQEVAAKTIRVASATVLNLLNRNVEHARLTQLASVLSDFRRMVPTGEVDWFDELTSLQAMIRAGRDVEARAKAESLLAAMTPTQLMYFQVLRMMAESCVSTRDWSAARDILDQFADAAESGALRRFDFSHLVRNVGVACLHAMADQDDAAFALFDSVGRVAEIAHRNRVVTQTGDRDVIVVFRALRAYLETNEVECAAWLDRADLDEINSADRTGILGVLYRLLRTWCTDKARPSSTATFVQPEVIIDHASGSSPQVPDTVLPLDENTALSSLLNLGAEPAPAHAVGLVQVKRAAGRPPRDPMEIAVETCLALRILGLPAQIAEVCLQVLRDSNDLTLTDPEQLLKLSFDNPANIHAVRNPHHAAWVESSGHLVDPVVPQLYAVRAVATTRLAHRHPVVVPFPPEQEFPILRRDGLLVAYNLFRTYDVCDVATALPPDRRTVCETNALFVAFQAVTTLAATGDHFVSAVENAHPELAGRLIRPERRT